MRHIPRALMLFAAGYGTRMAPLTDNRPKPLIPVGGRALIDHALDQAAAVAPDRVVVNLHYLPDMLRSHLAGRNIRFSPEQTLLETGGGLRHALPLLGGGPVFALNTDTVWTGPSPLAQLADAWDPDRMDALLLLATRAGATGHTGPGDFHMDGAGRLTRGAHLIYTGAQILQTDRLAEIAEPAFSLNRLWDRMQADGRLFGLMHRGGWCDVGRPASIALAEDLLRKGMDV
jgi:MurNAc alpha-1-phosphate uridylyltransferase